MSSSPYGNQQETATGGLTVYKDVDWNGYEGGDTPEFEVCIKRQDGDGSEDSSDKESDSSIDASSSTTNGGSEDSSHDGSDGSNDSTSDCKPFDEDNPATWENLPAGAYKLVEKDPGSRWEVSYSDETVVVGTEGTAEATVTNRLRRGQITVFKYADLNGNGQQDDGEGPLAGWEMCLYYPRRSEQRTKPGVVRRWTTLWRHRRRWHHNPRRHRPRRLPGL